MQSLVLDPSIVIKWYVPEVMADEAARLKEHIEKKSWWVAVPQLFFIESANVLWKKSCLKKELPFRDARLIYARIAGLPFHVAEDRKLLPHAIELAAERRVSVYDAMYLACAIDRQSVFVTADFLFTRRFADSNLSKYVAFLDSFGGRS